jgi:hypothetical protein
MRHLVVWGVVCASIAGVGMRPAEAQYMGTLNVTNLPSPCSSANGADEVDDQAAVQCAIDNLIPAGGGELYFPAGRYRFNTSINVFNKNISLRGAGQRTTRLAWYTGNTSGILFISNTGTVNHTLNVQSLSVLRMGGAGGVGINASWQTPANYTSLGATSATIDDVHVSYETGTPNTSYWQFGVYLYSALNARISNFNMQMDWQNGTYTASSAISIGGYSKGVVINDGHMGRTFYGVAVGGTSERVRIENVETSENVIGYLIDSTGGGNVIANCHAGVLPNGISVVNSPDPVIMDNLLFSSNTGIVVSSTPRAQIRGNQITAPLVGIRLEGTMSNAVVVGNQTNCPSGNTAIILQPGVSDSLVVANDPFAFQPCAITDNGTNNLKGINKP